MLSLRVNDKVLVLGSTLAGSGGFAHMHCFKGT